MLEHLYHCQLVDTNSICQLTRVVVDGEEELEVSNDVIDVFGEIGQTPLKDPDRHGRVFARVELHHR